MTFVLVRHKVQDFAKWKPVYDEHQATRKASGSKRARLFRSADNPNDSTLRMGSVEECSPVHTIRRLT